jgi:hypothetical protein
MNGPYGPPPNVNRRTGSNPTADLLYGGRKP